MKYRLTAFAVLLAIASALVLAPFSAAAAPAAKPKAGAVTVPVTGTASNGSTFSGAYTITKFVSTASGGLNAVGTLSGTLTDPATGAVTSVTNQAVTVPVTQAAGSCQILDLTLGPLHLDLLGLVVDLNQVHLNITAQQGSGNLLGNLLCAVANLLNGGNPLGSLANLLNQILGALGL